MKVVDRLDEIHSANVAASSTVTLFTLTIPANLKATITHFGNPINDTAALGNLTWKLTVNGVPQHPLAAVLDQHGDISQPYALSRPIKVNGGSSMSVIVTNSSGSTAYDAGCIVRGLLESISD
ncbi:MAG: hypothetical protein JSW62_04780 [Thermoplasmatales archaeon]|nr:MAG: hypothetical protein JSW62_04780 [Thermoplasmatales archaeon]